MARQITWIENQQLQAWLCSECDWKYPMPTLLSTMEARSAFDRLARASFDKHDCAQYPRSASAGGSTFTDRVRKYIERGYKPKDAVGLILQEVMLEHRSEPKKIERACAEADEFLRNLRQGKI